MMYDVSATGGRSRTAPAMAIRRSRPMARSPSIAVASAGAVLLMDARGRHQHRLTRELAGDARCPAGASRTYLDGQNFSSINGVRSTSINVKNRLAATTAVGCISRLSMLPDVNEQLAVANVR